MLASEPNIMLCLRAGVKRFSGLIYEELRGVMKVFMENLIRDAVTYTGKPVFTISKPNLTITPFRTWQKKDSHYN